jgi:hypothetical protein
MENSFLPNGYEQPKSGGGFTSLETGSNKLRIVSDALLMWLEWRDGKPTRHPYKGADSKPAKGSGLKDSVKHAWGMIVYNYKTKQIEVLELDKQGAISQLVALVQNPAWGHPKGYNIDIKKSGSGMDTEYMLSPEPPSEPSNEVIEAFTETPCDLSQLLVEGGNVFLSSATPQAGNSANPNTQPATTNAKVVTPENWVAGDAVPAGYSVNADTGALEKKKLPF